MLIDVGPLAVFFIANSRGGIFVGTAAFMIAVVVALATAWLLERRIPRLPLVTGIFVLVFGGLTLILQDDLFIKLKPTIVNSLFALILLIGLVLRRNFLKQVLSHAFQIDDRGWTILTYRWIGFFIFLAVLNEVVWRTQSTDTWVAFKLFGVMPLTVVFSLLQLPLIKRHFVAQEDQ